MPVLSPKEPEKLVPVQPPAKEPEQTIIPETFLWEKAFLVWSPGNQILKVSKDNHNVQIKVTDKSIVPAEYHEMLFMKKKSVTANVTVEKNGNAFKIVKIP